MATNGDITPGAPRSGSPHADSPRTASISLQAAATMNAGLQQESSRGSPGSPVARNQPSPQAGQRRSAVLMNLQLNDPALPAPGEMASEQSSSQRLSPQVGSASGMPPTADPHHHRAPSLGELHQELEAEQEAHVNRLLLMIRQQQLELQRLQSTNPLNAASSHAAEDSSAISERSSTHGTPIPTPSHTSATSGAPQAGSYSRSPIPRHPSSSFDVARAEFQRRSRTPSRGAVATSPRLRSTSISAESAGGGGEWQLGGRDESAFYQAETQMLTRENQMLRHRIRDLEKQLAELTPSGGVANEPPVPSHLTRSSTAEEQAGPAAGA